MGNLDVSTSSGAKMTSLSSEFAELSGLAKAKFYWPKLSKRETLEFDSRGMANLKKMCP